MCAARAGEAVARTSYSCWCRTETGRKDWAVCLAGKHDKQVGRDSVRDKRYLRRCAGFLGVAGHWRFGWSLRTQATAGPCQVRPRCDGWPWIFLALLHDPGCYCVQKGTLRDQDPQSEPNTTGPEATTRHTVWTASRDTRRWDRHGGSQGWTPNPGRQLQAFSAPNGRLFDDATAAC